MARFNCVTVLAPAKLNLALDVVGILPGGYHALDMTMQAISLYERVVIRRSPYLDLTLPGSNVKPGPGNTAIKAALAFFHYTGLLAGADLAILQFPSTIPTKCHRNPSLSRFSLIALRCWFRMYTDPHSPLHTDDRPHPGFHSRGSNSCGR